MISAIPWIKKILAHSLVASIVACIVQPVLAEIRFDIVGAPTALAQVGFHVASELLPALIDITKTGISTLSDWLEKKMPEMIEVNEAAARALAEQAGGFAEIVAQTHPGDANEIADSLQQGLVASGGAIAEIADLYKAAMRETADLGKLIEEMMSRIDGWACQSAEVRRGSLIENVEMRMKGRGGKQEIRVEEGSIIHGSQHRSLVMGIFLSAVARRSNNRRTTSHKMDVITVSLWRAMDETAEWRHMGGFRDPGRSLLGFRPGVELDQDRPTRPRMIDGE